VTPANRNLWLEVAALGLFLVGLVPLLISGLYTGLGLVQHLLPGELAIKVKGAVVSDNDLLVIVLSTGVPGATLIAAAWGLRSLLVEEGERQE
jgi:hypothetical protein